MNPIIKKLAEQAGMNIKTNVIGTALVFGTFEGYKTSHITVEELEMFAELVAAQEREWQGLTLEDIDDIGVSKDWVYGARWAEANLKEKNGG
jgi:hypothetical protein